ncbi:glycosyltransferase family 2 protein [Desmonostoc muscorum LEGE 12446]|uniref:glycosyltransferase family 2 protein n=1 Tax=Desmonostoc muscorum TaxID=1179 RepID=UPI001D14D462|nr:glycosyltransferase family 2 protein [Desmonostoc muscorum]MCF2146323.1 glycosyltransferase family 2 protein [Desmonostoc muscorum LEGE 12446]
MLDNSFNVPIAIIIFNRPTKAEQLLQVLRQVQPKQLFVIADGPRPNNSADVELCKATRTIFDHIDWDCKVLTNYAEKNLGCGLRPASGISWVFDHVEEAIILEDDCLPDLSFFQFCQELLEKYRYDQRIMHIAGTSSCIKDDQQPYSYGFSRYTLAWGWATWRRAWQYYDFDMKKWDLLRQTNFLLDILNGDFHAMKSWQTILETVYDKHDDCWDYQWNFTCWLQGGLTILPSVNLVSNIGIDGTHTTVDNHPYLYRPTQAMEFPLQHPIAIVRNTKVDQQIQNDCFDWYPNLWQKVQKRFRRIFRKAPQTI